MSTEGGDTYSRPLEAFPVLHSASEEQRLEYEIGKMRDEIRWPLLDEDIHINSFYDKAEPDQKNPLSITLKKFPQFNLAVFAREIGIHKTLLEKYISGMKKPSQEKKKEIENALHRRGQELILVEL